VERLQRLAESENIQYLLGLAKTQSQSATASSEKGSEPSASVPSVRGRTKAFSVATSLYLTEKELDNSAKTISEKRAAFVEFSRFFGDPDTNSVSSEMSISQGKLDFSSPHFQVYQKAKPIEILQKAMVPLDYGIKFPRPKIRE
jgi:hypothetical protein